MTNECTETTILTSKGSLSSEEDNLGVHFLALFGSHVLEREVPLQEPRSVLIFGPCKQLRTWMTPMMLSV